MTELLVNTENPTIYLKDYEKPHYRIEKTHLDFKLAPKRTEVVATSKVSQYGRHDHDLILDGEYLTLISIKIDGKELLASDYVVSDTTLCIKKVPVDFELEIKTHIEPIKNTALSGLYISSGNFCTQCEAQGFRRITYFLDRPDNLTIFDVTLTADKVTYPVLLSNGNPQACGDNSDGSHWYRWYDPHPKPSYLFALVAGDLAHISDEYTTLSGQQVALNIYSEAHNINQCDFAMEALKKSMQWDEQCYGREYDLSVYNIVAVDDFNMGAMENKGLNIFNTKYVLANPETATDQDYQAVEAVIAHEYFHNWSGNRVTCRDWFQLSLKEGFTVFRDQQFSEDMNSKDQQRVQQVKLLRAHQFKEDAGPMAHPIRPDSYQEINNFYTVTIYEKGAEVIRMLQQIVGKEGFRKGSDHYFESYDGQAVTTDQFIESMEKANQVDLTQFSLWYHQAGTPELTIKQHYDSSASQLTLECQQMCPPTPGQSHKQPFVIPIAVALFDETGQEITHETLILHQQKQNFVFNHLNQKPLVSVLRNFSAPVKLHFSQSMHELSQLVRYESDGFARFEAMQTCILQALEPLLQQKELDNTRYTELKKIFTYCLNQDNIDKSLVAEMLQLPSEQYVYERNKKMDPKAIHHAIKKLKLQLAKDLDHSLILAYKIEKEVQQSEASNSHKTHSRALMNVILSYLAYVEDEKHHDLIHEQYATADNMTNQFSAFQTLLQTQSSYAEKVIQDFYNRWKDYPLLINKWFATQASVAKKTTLDDVQALLKHKQFSLKNPNNVYALIRSFASNFIAFHQQDGRAYAFYVDMILKLDAINPQIAARLVSAFNDWRDMSDPYQTLIKQQLINIQKHQKLSTDVKEIVSKALIHTKQ